MNPHHPPKDGYGNGAPFSWLIDFVSNPFGTITNVLISGKP